MKTLLIAGLMIATFPLFAQIGYGPEAGIGMSSMRFAPPFDPIPYRTDSKSPVASDKIGMQVDIPLHRQVYFQTGLYFSRKGAIRQFSYFINDSFNERIHQEVHINYVDLPLNVLYKTAMQGKFRFFIGLGATLSYLTGGRNKIDGDQIFQGLQYYFNMDRQVVAGETFAGFDAGVNVLSGCEFGNGLFFRLYYTAGLNDIALRHTEIDKNRMWGLSAGYFFGKGRNIYKEAAELIDHPQPNGILKE